MYLLGLGFLVSFLAQADPAPPFWKAKEKVYARVQNHEIILNVKSEEFEGRQRLIVAGGGQVHAPRDFVFKALQNYEELAKLSDFVRESKFDPETKILKFLVSAFGYRARMETRFEAIPHESKPQIKFEVVNGPVKGFHGYFTVESIADAKSEIGMSGEYVYTRFPLPKIFLAFGLEMIYQRLATRLRSQLESDYKKVKVQ